MTKRFLALLLVVAMMVTVFAGCHIYMESDDVIYVGANFVTFHSSSSGKKKIHFPKKVSVYEVYEDKLYAENTDTVEFDTYLGETKMFYYY